MSTTVIRPMLVTRGPLPPDDDRYAYEVKWDGFRALVQVDETGVTVASRNGHDMTPHYPELRRLDDSIGVISSSSLWLMQGDSACGGLE